MTAVLLTPYSLLLTSHFSLLTASLHSPRLLYLRCPRSEGLRRVNRVRTSPVAALSDVRCRFGVPGAFFISGPRYDRSCSPLPSQTIRRSPGAGPRRRRATGRRRSG